MNILSTYILLQTWERINTRNREIKFDKCFKINLHVWYITNRSSNVPSSKRLNVGHTAPILQNQRLKSWYKQLIFTRKELQKILCLGTRKIKKNHRNESNMGSCNDSCKPYSSENFVREVAGIDNSKRCPEYPVR